MTRFSIIATLFVLATICNQSNAQSFGNPIVGGSDSRHVEYDPFSDTTYIDNTRHRIRESAYDHDRNLADFGSRKYVDRYIIDNNGCRIHEYGWTWTTNGKPHGDLTREVVTFTPNYSRPRYGGCPRSGGGVINRDREIISYGSGGTVNRNRDMVSFDQLQGRRGGTVNRNRDIVSFSQP